MTSRRSFIKTAALGAGVISTGQSLQSAVVENQHKSVPMNKPLVLSTWDFGLKANVDAWAILSAKGRALDAVEAGVKVAENDLHSLSVGLAGLPDREGHTTLDACIMDEHYNCGSVAFLEKIKNPISVARMVMEKTPHIMLVGSGAQQFALENGFTLDDYKNPEAQKAYEAWLVEKQYKPVINIENHDTIGMIAMDMQGNLSGACTTSGLAYKVRGRVGDSPIIGAGLYVDNEIGAATATGTGEEVIRIAGTHLVVELMRQKYSPYEACKEAVMRMVKIRKEKTKDFQVGFIALNKAGEFGAYCLQPGFNYAVFSNNIANELFKSDSYYPEQ
ncbi:MAG TPA: N(4)-(beta-N-acetylglucosaminyl)-L-asparaginase [Chitinophagales bacterium]|nr:N(4)-(beta-N-acetylglucosaminyl)-L-asparaginase [Chitinophagales bacterium]HMU70470.1 N(4)-(beta-N-acetylglucosaminyl)-L-asparaginase [Chitinophagales bacterium]HMX05814.1 N(4)-(beta-N-acetylglucosaminyl)-L-asparaginase [Chitinophagales bacterium]HMZ88605.1 N(4)-(beta-N-acetylglucosaminyl)-L-asparaginase [Chitinophagales bacterium]HNA57359.1 N(4)-(beta-N-acetylglucosaminyl)-L-asparaginase [Chitinophagales bacterium]